MADAEVKNKVRQRARVTVTGDGMAATLILFRPATDEPQVTMDEVMEEVKGAGVIHGIDEEAIRRVVTNEDYNNPTTIATGDRPIKGENAKFEYHFDTSLKHTPKEDEEGRIDYRDINFIQNVDKDAVLATKIPPTDGVPGKSVTGKEIKGPSGRDIPFNKGVNTVVSDDGLRLIATASGAIVYLHGKVAVNDLTVINGDVDHTVGNIECKGSVRIAGSVKAGFTLKIDGDLEVNGNVEDSTVEVKGNIVVKGGFFGKGHGVMSAGGDITLKFAEGQRIAAGGNILVGGEIINCNVFAKNKIRVKGQKGKIIGGETKAGKEIRASVLGSDAGTATHLYAAYDTELMRKYDEVAGELKRLQEDGERVKTALYGLYKLQLAGKLPPDKLKALEELKKFSDDLPGTIESLKVQKEALEEKMREFKDACIIGEKVVHNGVVAHFGPIYRENLEDHLHCKLTIEGNQVLLSEFRGGGDD